VYEISRNANAIFVLTQTTNPLPELSGREKEEHMPHVSFARDIKPLCRAVDISHMKRYGIKLDDYTFMSNPDNANKVLGTLSPHEDDPPSMPPGGPYWTADQLALFAQWQKDGYQP
jgi:hypothetical protein